MCRAEQPRLNQLAEKFEGRVAFLGVSNRDTVAAGRAYGEQLDVPYPLAWSPIVWTLYGIRTQPATVVLDSRGRVVHRSDESITPKALTEILEDELKPS